MLVIVCFCATSHRQNDAELCLAAHHSCVSLSCFFERICFNHRTHPGQFGEVRCVLGVGWCSRNPAVHRSTATDQLYWRDLNGIAWCTDHSACAVWAEAINQLRQSSNLGISH